MNNTTRHENIPIIKAPVVPTNLKQRCHPDPDSIINMRDRRGTNLSTSSLDSHSSSSAPSTCDPLFEKRYSSPPPSMMDKLPLPATHDARTPRTRRTVAVKALAVLCGLALFWQYMCRGEVASIVQHHEGGTDLIAGTVLPEQPTALIVADPTGTSKWTISIPHTYKFPLEAHFYRDMCTNGDLLRDGIRASPGHARRKWWRKHGHLTTDETFLDVDQAEEVGALPASNTSAANVCNSSMTVVLESDQASFGEALLLLWLSYGLAKKEGRAFFIDDSRWAWGSYASFFQPPSSPDCSPPPAHHIVPCRENARHLMVSSATAKWTFGPSFQRELRGHHKHGLASQNGVFELMRTGYEALFHLIDTDENYVTTRMEKLREEASSHHGRLVGMHIRRGDLHPFEYQYSKDYLPLERYADAAEKLVHLSLNPKEIPSDANASRLPLLLASDDPEIVNSAELRQATSPFQIQRAQEKILLATKAALDRAAPVQMSREAGSPYVKHLEENNGWEGGFYSGLFFTLGGATLGDQAGRTEQALQLRKLVGRAYLMDVAVLGRSEGVVCAVSSASCRALAVMMGWEAVKDGKWVNVDDHRLWSWNGQRGE